MLVEIIQNHKNLDFGNLTMFFIELSKNVMYGAS